MSDLAQARTFDEFMEGIWRQNPVFVMVLGMCPTLAVTVSAVNALSMGISMLDSFLLYREEGDSLPSIITFPL